VIAHKDDNETLKYVRLKLDKKTGPLKSGLDPGKKKKFILTNNGGPTENLKAKSERLTSVSERIWFLALK